MFCPSCGDKLENSNQKFCPNCGSEIQTTLAPEISQAPQISIVRPPVPQPAPPSPRKAVNNEKPIKTGGTGPYSKKCLAFALIWPGFFIVALYIGFIFMIFRRFSFTPRNPGLWMIPFVLHLISLIFSINSIVNGSNARKFEFKNGLQKAGTTISVFGIILNVIFLVIVSAILGASIFTM